VRHDLHPWRHQGRRAGRGGGPSGAARCRNRDDAADALSPGAALALKLVVTPLLIGAASLAGRRWGSAVGGWLSGTPLTSGSFVLFLALDHGPRFAARAAAARVEGPPSFG